MPRRPTTTHRKLPRQRRAVVTFDAVLEAAERVIEQEGLTRFTTGRVAEVAGVSVGSIYQYFPNKESILATLNERYLGRQLARFVEAFQATPPAATIEEAIAGFVRAVIASHTGERRILGALYEKLPVTLYQRTLNAYLPYLIALLERHRASLTIQRLDLAALLLLHAGDGLIRTLFLEPAPQPELLIDEFVQMVARFVRAPI